MNHPELAGVDALRGRRLLTNQDWPTHDLAALLGTAKVPDLAARLGDAP